ncbi:MAG: hypothetical protein NTV50_00055, partial [Planctomycetota bacterium]|nr:hypothetical protein [Planctomycetota bacterium]
MGAKPKSANGAVAVGLPHRNRSLFKNAHINKQIRIKKKTSHGLTLNFKERRIRIKSHTRLITKKVLMERLQWGFPIATALSLK